MQCLALNPCTVHEAQADSKWLSEFSSKLKINSLSSNMIQQDEIDAYETPHSKLSFYEGAS